MALTNRQVNLVKFLNQLSQNIASKSGVNNDFSLDLPGLDVDFNLGIGGGGTGDGGGTTPPSCNTPTTLREVLCNSLNEQVQVTTPFGMIAGTLIAVKNDYIVIVESSGDQVLVRIDKIEFVSEM